MNDVSRGGNALIDPLLDVRQNDVLVDIVEQVVKVALVELERLVGRAGHLVKALATARLGGLVERAMPDKHGNGERPKLRLQPLVGAHHLRDGLRWLHLMRNQRIIVH
jgi:hypothetical protein